MPCLVALLAIISPRLALFVVWILSDTLSRAYDSWIIPLLGFFLLPWTTLAYAAFWDWGPGREVTGIEWFFVVLAFLADLSSHAGGNRARSRSAGRVRRGENSSGARTPPCSRPSRDPSGRRLRPRSRHRGAGAAGSPRGA